MRRRKPYWGKTRKYTNLHSFLTHEYVNFNADYST